MTEANIENIRRRMESEMFEYTLIVEKLARIKNAAEKVLGNSRSDTDRIETAQLSFKGLAATSADDLGLFSINHL